MPIPRFRIRTLMIAVGVVAAIGSIGGLVAGLLAPKVVVGLYALDGQDPDETFSPALWGSWRGLLIGACFGGGVGLLVCLVSRPPRMTTRRWMIAVGAVGVILASVVIGGRLRDERELRLGKVKLSDIVAEGSWQNARFHQEQFLAVQKLLSDYTPSTSEVAKLREDIPRTAAERDREIAYAKLWESRKPRYKYYADRPWLPLPRDLPGSPWLAVPPPE